MENNLVSRGGLIINSTELGSNSDKLLVIDSSGEVKHINNITKLSQLSNDSGYITGYTETDTLQSVTNRGNTTSKIVGLNGGFYGTHYGSPSGASDTTIWAISPDYPDWGIFYDQASPDKIYFKSSGVTSLDIDLEGGQVTTKSHGNSSQWNAAYSHTSSDGTDHTYINQSVTTSASPTFNNMTLNGDLLVNNNIISFSGLSGSNVDHIWHNDSTYNGHPGQFNFVSDGTVKGVGNGALRAGSFYNTAGDEVSYEGHPHSADDITSGTLSYSRLPFTSANVSNWNEAHRWGNHEDAGYTKTHYSGLSYTDTITINGDHDKYYPVIFKGGNQNILRTIKIWRQHNETAPHEWNTSTHHGSLMLHWMGNFGGWGGASYSEFIFENTSQYTTLLADCYRFGNSRDYLFFLRGGGATYHIASDQSMNVQIAYNSDQVHTSGEMNAPAPRTSVNSSRLNGLKLATQSWVNDQDYLTEHQDISGKVNKSGDTMTGSLTTPNIFLNSGGSIYSNHHGGYILKDHSNGNVTLSAAGSQLYLGYANTSVIRLSSTLTASDGSTNIASTTGVLYYKGENTDSRYLRSETDTLDSVTNRGSTTSNAVASTHSVGGLNPNNTAASARLGWNNNIARIRVGGSGTGVNNGFAIEGVGDKRLMYVDDNGRIESNGLNTNSNINILDSNPILRLRTTAGSNQINSGRIIFSEGGTTDHVEIHYDGASNDLKFRSIYDASDMFRVDRSTGNGWFKGDVTAPDFVGNSDERLKENIETLDPQPIHSLYKSFNFIEDESKQKRVGVIAQELEVRHPEFVRTDDEGMKSVSYTDLHSSEIAYLKKQNETLEGKTKNLDVLVQKQQEEINELKEMVKILMNNGK